MGETQKQFKVGDEVAWTSQAGGFTKSKTGKVVAVVPTGMGPRQFLPDGLGLDTSGLPRSHESYIIRVGTQKKCYWPLVKYLSPAAPAQTVDA